MVTGLNMSCLPLVLFVIIQLLSFVSAVPQHRPPSGSCGEGWLYNGANDWMSGDKFCRDLYDFKKKVVVFKGCKCEFWSTKMCGNNPADPGGLEANIHAVNKHEGFSFTKTQGVNSYLCYHAN